MAHPPAQIEAAPLASGATEFDLSAEAAEEGTSKRKTHGPYIIIFCSIAGLSAAAEGVYYLLFVDHTLSDRLQDWVWIGAGVAIIAVGTYAVRVLGTNEVIRLRLEPSGPAFIHKKGKVQSWRWDDPALKINICHVTRSIDDILPKDDARRKRAHWLDAFSPPSKTIKLETTLPRGAAEALVTAARNGGAVVRIVPVAFFWQSGGEYSPGSLVHEEQGHLSMDHKLNGEITQLRSTSSSWNKSG